MSQSLDGPAQDGPAQDGPAPNAPTPDTPVLTLEDVSVRLSGAVILESVSFTLQAGDLAWLAGANGAGKSTLLRAVAGLLPHNGDISIRGHRPRSLAAKASFVYVPDVAALYEDLTLREHAVFTARVYAQQGAEARALGWLDAFSLTRFLGESPSRHSRGMRQKLALALALGLETPLLMLDEPFNALDVEAQAVLKDALGARAAAGGAVLLTAHQTTLSGARVLRLEGGKLTSSQTASHAHSPPREADVR